MGPRSTSPFLEAVLDECERQYGARADIDFPPMLIYSLPTPFYPDRSPDHEALATAIEAGARRLGGCGVDLIAMPCNTAHLYYERIRAAAGVPLLHIVEETAAELRKTDKRSALLASRATAEAQLYQELLQHSGVELYHGEELQRETDRLIATMKGGSEEGEQRECWARMKPLLDAAGVEVVLIACTDLSPLGSRLFFPEGYIAIDSGAALARATVEYYLKLSGRERQV
jgi:aspartate racemase